MIHTPVLQEHKKVLIIGGGESLRDFDFDSIIDFDGAIITVNSVIMHLPRADYWMSVDLAKPHVALKEKRADCYYYAGYPTIVTDYNIVKGVHYLEKIIPENGDYRLQEDGRKITGGVDSIYGAINLAYHFKATQIILLGVDCYGYGHWYDLDSPYNGFDNPDFKKDHLDNLPKRYACSLKQLKKRRIRVVNGSPESRIDCFPRVSPEEALSYFDK